MGQKKKLKAVILAAGKGTRLHSEQYDLPKVMREAAGKPLLGYVLEALDFIAPEDTVIVVGYKKEQVVSAFEGYAFAEQREQLGTGHAVMAAYPLLDGYDGDVLVCCGDMPLLTRESYLGLCREHEKNGAVCTILSGTSAVPLPYGRIVRDEYGEFERMVEERDCTPEQKMIDELNSGVYIFDAKTLGSVLSGLRSDNSQGEYYLTDAPALMRERGGRVCVYKRELGFEIIGVNTPEQLAETERIIQSRLNTGDKERN